MCSMPLAAAAFAGSMAGRGLNENGECEFACVRERERGTEKRERESERERERERERESERERECVCVCMYVCNDSLCSTRLKNHWNI